MGNGSIFGMSTYVAQYNSDPSYQAVLILFQMQS